MLPELPNATAVFLIKSALRGGNWHPVSVGQNVRGVMSHFVVDISDNSSDPSRMSTGSNDWKFIDRKARELGVADEARRKWRSRGHVPHRWRLPLLAAAAREGISLDQSIFDEFSTHSAGPQAFAGNKPRIKPSTA